MKLKLFYIFSLITFGSYAQTGTTTKTGTTTENKINWGQIGGQVIKQKDLVNYIDTRFTNLNLTTLLNGKVDKVLGKGLSTEDFTTAYKNNVDANTTARHTHPNKTVLDNTTASYTTAEQSKLAGIQLGATANSSDAYLLNRTNHTGTQDVSTINNLSSFIDANNFAYISTDTTTRPPVGKYKLALPSDNIIRIVKPTGNTEKLYENHEKWALQSTVIDSMLSTYTISNTPTNFYVYNSTEPVSNTKIYNSSLFYYLPKNTPNYTISINLPNPTSISNKDFGFMLILNKRGTINFNYPLYYTVKNTDYGISTIQPTVVTIPSTNIRAVWMYACDSCSYTIYVKNNKWFIQ